MLNSLDFGSRGPGSSPYRGHRVKCVQEYTYVKKRTQVLFQSTSCPTGLQDIFIYFIFDTIVCFGGISLIRTLCDAYYEKDESN